MSDSHHHDPIEDNIETHPVKLAIGVAIGAAALIVGIMLVAQFAIGSYGERSLKDDPSMTPEAVAKRIAPVARVVVDPNAATAPAAAPAPASPATPVVAAMIPAAATKTVDASASGKATYDSVCMACHASGVANAPKLGDKAAWALRIKQGKDVLYASAIKGKGAMPAKGGNPAIADAAVKAAVDYLVAAAK